MTHVVFGAGITVGILIVLMAEMLIVQFMHYAVAVRMTDVRGVDRSFQTGNEHSDDDHE